jgi:hypothetical protein
MPEPVINVAALEPLFAPHEEPNQHRARAQGDQPAQTKKGQKGVKKVSVSKRCQSRLLYKMATLSNNLPLYADSPYVNVVQSNPKS